MRGGGLGFRIGVGIALVALSVSSAGAQPDPYKLVRCSLRADGRNWERLQDYEWVEWVRKVDFDKHGRPKKTDVKAFQVLQIQGTPYRRLISRFDKPLSPEEEESERIKLERVIAERRAETPRQRAHRIREYRRRSRRVRDPMKEIAAAFLFEVAGEDEVAHRSVWVVRARPRPGYRPRTSRAKLFTGLEGTLYIDKETCNWVRAEAELVKDLWFGLFLVRMYRGGAVVVENAPVDGDFWAPVRLQYRVKLRIGFFKLLSFEQEIRYRGYHKAGVGAQGRRAGDSKASRRPLAPAGFKEGPQSGSATKETSGWRSSRSPG